MLETESVESSNVETTATGENVTEQTGTKPDLQTLSDDIDAALNGKEQSTKPTQQQTETQTVQDIIDLANAKKVRLDGKEYSIDELKRERMLQSDYTRKTQALSQERKFYENLHYDLKKVEQDPQKFIAEFKKVYPKQFHKYVSDYETVPESQSTARNQTTEHRGQLRIEDLPPEVKNVLDYIESQQKQTADAAVDAVIQKNLNKYPHARQKEVLAEWGAMIDAHKNDPSTYAKPTEADVERLFEQSHKEIESLFAKLKTQQQTAQINANKSLRGPGSGGATPGVAPVRPKNMREAAEMARAAVLGADSDA